ncbi:60 kDa SS-A/Ro ribonucleoprotein-like [Oopsacas minuta]|uniref:60 kDa SS-A/Ro ribonucleoprotein-like n=1 Tax=Oopsacas minuta TaxID=111878 RepID=A0AAV7KLW8_9METZ|nr:60 kDa SS-A/Ro ribonucleoprotein-like [Oopsacas minuta]
MATATVAMETESQIPIPQTVGLSGQIPNSAGGYSWPISDMGRLRRFLCLGSEGGSYYINEKKLGKENAKTIVRMLDTGEGQDVVIEILQYSTEGRTAKQEPIIFALAICARLGDAETKKSAYIALPKVCRIPTHLFSFIEYCESLSKGTGWGRAHRRAISEWYTEKAPYPLSILVTKYQQRNGWSHRDLLRLCHLKTDRDELNIIFRYIIKGMDQVITDYEHLTSNPEILKVFEFFQAVEKAKSCTKPEDIIPLINIYGLVREHIPTPLLSNAEVWRALLQKMPMTAMIRNLGKMTAIELLAPLSGELISLNGSIFRILIIKLIKVKQTYLNGSLHPIRSGGFH